MRDCWAAGLAVLLGCCGSAAWAGDGWVTVSGATTAAQDSYSPEERAKKAVEVLSDSIDEAARLAIIRKLSTSGYSEESAEALADIASGPKYSAETRFAAITSLHMFMANPEFTAPRSSYGPPGSVFSSIRDKLSRALDTEKEKMPLGVLQELIFLGLGDRIRPVLGDKFRGHPIEVWVLESIGPRNEAVARLWELSQAAPPATRKDGWQQRMQLGFALVRWKDKRGIDVLLDLLTVKEPWPAEKSPAPGDEDSNADSFRQSLHNTFSALATTFDEDFGCEVYGPWKPQLPEATAKMIAWWKEHREAWSFEEAESTVVPKVVPGKALTKRQARLLAAALATEAFAKGKFTRADGKPVGPFKFAPEQFNDIQQKDGRWLLKKLVAAGPEAFIDFALDGTDQKVTVNYTWD